MIDEEGIVTRLDKLKEYIGYLKTFQNTSLDKLKEDYIIKGAICRYFQLAVECVTDIGELLVSSLRLRKPKDAKEVIIILGERKIIPSDFAEKFAPVAGFRNVLVHEYLEIDLDKVYSHLQNDLGNFDFYAKKIAQCLQTQKR